MVKHQIVTPPNHYHLATLHMWKMSIIKVSRTELGATTRTELSTFLAWQAGPSKTSLDGTGSGSYLEGAIKPETAMKQRGGCGANSTICVLLEQIKSRPRGTSWRLLRLLGRRFGRDAAALCSKCHAAGHFLHALRSQTNSAEKGTKLHKMHIYVASRSEEETTPDHFWHLSLVLWLDGFPCSGKCGWHLRGQADATAFCKCHLPESNQQSWWLELQERKWAGMWR